MTTISNVPPDVQSKWPHPSAGLAICTVAVSFILFYLIVTVYGILPDIMFQVERAFRFWKTGHLVIPSKRSSRKFSKNLWGFATGELIRSTKCLTDKQWKKLKTLAMDCLEGTVGVTEEVLCVRAKVSTGRAFCFEHDSESGSDSDVGSESN